MKRYDTRQFDLFPATLVQRSGPTPVAVPGKPAQPALGGA